MAFTLTGPHGPAVPALWGVGAALIALAPHFVLTPFASEYDAQRGLEIVAVGGLVVALVATPAFRDAWLSVWARVPRWAASVSGAFVVLGLVSAAMAARPVYAFAEVASFVLIGVAALAFASSGRAAARRGMALVAVLGLGAYVVAVLPFHLVDVLSGAPEVWPARHLGFGNVRHYNQLQVWTLPLVWALAASVRARPGAGRGRLWTVRAVGAASVALLVASGGRGIVVALVGGLAVTMATVRTGRRAFAFEVATSVALGAALWVAVFSGEPGMTALDRLEDGSNGRAELWAGALRLIAAHPWLGVGPMHFAYYPVSLGAHPHNVALQVAAEWGLPAALLAGGALLASTTAFLGHARRAEAADVAWNTGLTVALVAAFGSAMLDGFVVAPTSQIVAAMGVGTLLAEGLPESPHVPAGLAGRFALAAATLPCVAVLVGVVASDGPTLWRRPFDMRFSQVGEKSLPRFWSTGQIASRLPPDHITFWPRLHEAVAPPHPRPAARRQGPQGTSAAPGSRPLWPDGGPRAVPYRAPTSPVDLSAGGRLTVGPTPAPRRGTSP